MPTQKSFLSVIPNIIEKESDFTLRNKISQVYLYYYNTYSETYNIYMQWNKSNAQYKVKSYLHFLQKCSESGLDSSIFPDNWLAHTV